MALRARGKPFSAIVLWHASLRDEIPRLARSVTPDDDQPQGVGGDPTGPGRRVPCRYVDALANRDADALARKIADERARTFRCATDKPVILGETGPGLSS
jgi:hypothetical protein